MLEINSQSLMSKNPNLQEELMGTVEQHLAALLTPVVHRRRPWWTTNVMLFLIHPTNPD